MLMMRRATDWDPLAVLFTVGCAIAPAQASGQAQGYRPIGTMNVWLDTLERHVLSPDSCNHRMTSMITISGAGWVRTDVSSPPPPYPGIVARLERIYRQTGECGLREAIVGMMGLQAEAADAAAFLARVAQDQEVPQAAAPRPTPGVLVLVDTPPIQALAIGGLTFLGQPGEAALRRLYAAGTVRQRDAREQLEALARRGFPTRRN